ncbi:glycogen/starch synthase [Candidatus Woesearchaeota archaeon]|nr:glycogen/starch synthase [Candidatus Woesearchaeota archaeon]
MEKKADFLFEVSWEVCNKVGGIYTVVSSKAAQMMSYYKSNYFLIGPYFANKALGDFEEEVPDKRCKSAFDELKKEGILCHYGKWLIKGKPNAILIDFENYKQNINNIKKELWDSFKIDSLNAPYDYDEPVSWGHAVGKLIEKLAASLNSKCVAHFHEWLSGSALLYLAKKNVKIGKVFTTHATTLGRTLANSNVEIYSIWDKIDAEKEAYNYHVESKHQLEKHAALNADVFTTVSEITSMESERMLKIKPKVLLPNGLDIEKFPTFEEITIKHRMQRDRIRQFLLYYFFPYYAFEIKETVLFFIAGRYEFRDKGIDIFIKSLAKLNEQLKQNGSKKTIAAFIFVPSNIRNIKQELLENKTHYQDVIDALEEVMDDLRKNVVYSLIGRKSIVKEDLFEKDFMDEIKSKITKMKRNGNPSISTHDLYNEDNDLIMNALKSCGLNNKKEDRVKIIYYPIYLNGADGLLNLSYYEAMQGCHLGIFPSYYEPWGYTPLEAGALGVSSVTTDLAGFGRYFCTQCAQEKTPGIFILNRMNKKDNEVTAQLSKIMLDFANFTSHERIANKIQARKVASTVDWSLLVKNYINAHNLAVEKATANTT